ncbi:hypothetical protein HNR60_003643 [Rhodopseudomonas rhenobacensis]|uniref:Uncharacterized protein n=1 Tax=Rhodopseudomonas rhenobacensis TaxID=87461 RepID=A0A7W8E099_9BRAD|nr:hypothetical protein [Rhodopseudomonas rhenobacensis]MBB5048873.1 hypothetical protein [Rhodopseudomonas rhenobacensis]
MSWSARFSPPIPLPKGGELATLQDARVFLIRLPRHECNSPRWQAALAAVLMVGNDGGPTVSPASE